jgi:hypothetical protein
MAYAVHFFALGLTALFGLSACESKICGPADQKPCSCASGPGMQTCNAKGTEWGKCECTMPRAAQAAEPERPQITIVSAEDLGPADPKVNPDSKIIRVTYDRSGSPRGEATLTDAKGRKFTARADSNADPLAQRQAPTFIVPNDTSELRLGLGPDDRGKPIGEIKPVEAAERFKQRMIRERK